MIMANQRHPDKKPVSMYILKEKKTELFENAKSHGVYFSDIVKATTSDYLRLNKKQQRRLLDNWEGRRNESE